MLNQFSVSESPQAWVGPVQLPRYTNKGIKIVDSSVESGSELYTGAMPSYDGLTPDYNHQSVDHSAKEYVRGKVHTNNIENFWSLWKRCIKGTHVHISPQYMNRYLDEEMFRYNNRASDDSGRFLVAANSVIGCRLTHRDLTSNISQ